MLNYMILDPIKDYALCVGHCILILFVISWVDRDSHSSQGEGLDAMSIQNRQDPSLSDDKVGCPVQPVLIPQSIHCHPRYSL